MSNEKSAEVRRRLAELLGSEGGVIRAFLVVGAKGFKATLSTNGDKQSMSLGNGSFAVLMLSEAELEGLPPGVYDPEFEANKEPASP